MPTGSGKTRIAALDSTDFAAATILYVAHTHEILDVAEKEFSHLLGKDEVNRGWQEHTPSSQRRVHLSTIQSIQPRMGLLPQVGYDYVVIDEFHHVAASSYRKLLEAIKPRFLLGLTATPFRGDKQDVIELCNGNVIVNFELRSGIETGILVPFHYYGCFDNVDYSTLVAYADGYSIKDLNKALIIPERDKAIIEKWQEYAGGLPSIAFCCSREHAKRVAHSFRDSGVNAEEYLGDTPLDQREELVRKLQHGDLSILCAVDVLNEGVDIPFVESLLFLRPTESKRIFFQQLGRGLRRTPGKLHVIVLDFIGNFKNSYRITEYIGLDPAEQPLFISSYRPRTAKEVLNVPTGCKVYFDEKVIDLFAQQVLDPSKATRYNIGQILLYQYHRTARRIGRLPTKKEIDRYQILHSGLYELVFGSWAAFMKVIEDLEF